MTLSLLRNIRASAHHALYYSSAAQNAIWFGQSSFLSARIHVPKHDKYTLSNVSISYAQYVIGFLPLIRLTDGSGHWACLPYNPRRALFHLVLQLHCLGFRHDVGGGSHGLFITSVDFFQQVHDWRCLRAAFAARPIIARGHSTTGFRSVAWRKCTRIMYGH